MQRKIAIIDDDTIFQFTTKIKIEKLNSNDEAILYGDTREFIQYLKTATETEIPAMIFLDINMPYMDDWSFLDAFANLELNTETSPPIYMLSSSLDLQDKERAENNPWVSGYATKPIKEEELAQILHA